VTFPVQGAWTRASATIAHGEPFETQYVYWLQAGPAYADLRVPFHPGADSRCFTGRSGWTDDGYRWTHALDLEPANPEDVGELAMEGGRLVERGWWDDVPYEEVWVRIDDGNGPFRAAEAPDGRACLVQAGDHAIAVADERDAGGAFTACYRVLGPDGWETAAAIGSAEDLPTPAAIPSDWLPVGTEVRPISVAYTPETGSTPR
jgi:hypothetical protein